MLKNASKNYMPYIVIVIIFLAISFVFIFKDSKKVTLKNDVAISSVDGEIVKLTETIRANPKDTKTYIALSNAYLQKIRETADTSYYLTIDELLNKAAKIDPMNSEIYANRANLENGRHHFNSGLELINKAIGINPNVTTYYGTKADSEIELGMYAEAETTLQTMVNKKPNYSSYTRIAYLRELNGDIEGAKGALELAISAGSAFKENISWAYFELGLLQMRDNLDEAERSFNSSITLSPNYPGGLEGLGKVAFARGNKEKAQEYFEKALSIHPLAQYAVDLGDLESDMGNTQKAGQYYSLAETAYNKSASSGMDVNLEYSIFLSDHGDQIKALEKAEQAFSERTSIYTADALAWANYKNNNLEEAEKYVKQAMKLGENDPLILFHAGMIEKAKGNDVEAKRLFKLTEETHPYFSIFNSKILNAEVK